MALAGLGGATPALGAGLAFAGSAGAGLGLAFGGCFPGTIPGFGAGFAFAGGAPAGIAGFGLGAGFGVGIAVAVGGAAGAAGAAGAPGVAELGLTGAVAWGFGAGGATDLALGGPAGLGLAFLATACFGAGCMLPQLPQLPRTAPRHVSQSDWRCLPWRRTHVRFVRHRLSQATIKMSEGPRICINEGLLGIGLLENRHCLYASQLRPDVPGLSGL